MVFMIFCRVISTHTYIYIYIYIDRSIRLSTYISHENASRRRPLLGNGPMMPGATAVAPAIGRKPMIPSDPWTNRAGGHGGFFSWEHWDLPAERCF